MKIVAALVILLGGCELYRKEGPGGGDAGPPGSIDGPVGKTFVAERSITFEAPGCPSFSQKNLAHTVNVDSLTQVRVDGALSMNVSVRNQPANEGIDPANVTFTFREFWDSIDGSTTTDVTYQLFTDGIFMTGEAMTFFPFNSPATGPVSCDYTWNVF